MISLIDGTIYCYITRADQVKKADAKADLDALRAAKVNDNYDEAGVNALDQAVTNGKNAISSAGTAEAVATALQNAKDTIDAVK